MWEASLDTSRLRSEQPVKGRCRVRARPIPPSTVHDLTAAKAYFPRIWDLANALSWPLPRGVTSARAWWRGDTRPSLSIYADGTRWTDHGADKHGGVIEMLATVEKLDNASACRRLVEIARTVAAGGILPPAAMTNPVNTKREPPTPIRLSADWTRGSEEDLKALAKLRGLPGLQGLHWASERGLLKFGHLFDAYEKPRSWLIIDSSRFAAQARRLDGKPWAKGAKAKTLSDSCAHWPIGLADARHAKDLYVAEGGPDFLVLAHLIAVRGTTDAAPVAILGATQSIADEAGPLVAGKRVTICPHDDAEGRKAKAKWSTLFHRFGATSVCALNIRKINTTGTPAKDLNDLVRAGVQLTQTHDHR